jgi:hypothetical protein
MNIERRDKSVGSVPVVVDGGSGGDDSGGEAAAGGFGAPGAA